METLETPVELRSVLDATHNNRGDLPDEDDLDARSQHNGGLRVVILTHQCFESLWVRRVMLEVIPDT